MSALLFFRYFLKHYRHSAAALYGVGGIILVAGFAFPDGRARIARVLEIALFHEEQRLSAVRARKEFLPMVV